MKATLKQIQDAFKRLPGEAIPGELYQVPIIDMKERDLTGDGLGLGPNATYDSLTFEAVDMREGHRRWIEWMVII